MLPEDEWLYLGAKTSWSSQPRLTLPQCVFVEYGILDGDRGGWWIWDEQVRAIQIANKDPAAVPGYSTYAELSDPGDGSATRFFTIPGEFRRETPEDHGKVPHERAITRDTEIHFISATELRDGDRGALYLFTTEELEERVQDPGIWLDDPANLARLERSRVSHLVDRETIGQAQTPLLAEQLDIAAGDVPDSFTIKRTILEVTELPPEVVDRIDLQYLLVRYGTSETTAENRAEDPRITQILNTVVDVETSYIVDERTLEIDIPFAIHDRHAAEFKLFVDVDDVTWLERIRETFADSPSCLSASISDSLEDRVYFVHADFRTTETPGGFVNNVVYPK